MTPTLIYLWDLAEESYLHLGADTSATREESRDAAWTMAASVDPQRTRVDWLGDCTESCPGYIDARGGVAHFHPCEELVPDHQPRCPVCTIGHDSALDGITLTPTDLIEE